MDLLQSATQQDLFQITSGITKCDDYIITKCDVSKHAFHHECCECTIKNTCSKFLEGKSLLMSYALSLEL